MDCSVDSDQAHLELRLHRQIQAAQATMKADITQEYGYLTSETKYRSFHLFLRFKCEASGNSGVYLHTEFEFGEQVPESTHTKYVANP